MEPVTPPSASPLRDLVRTTLRYLKTAAIVGVLVWVPLAVVNWWTSRPGPAGSIVHRDEYSFAPMPEDLGKLQSWIAKQPGVVDVEVRRGTKRQDKNEIEVVRLRYGSSSREALEPPWKQLGYPKPGQATRSWSGKLQITVAQDVGFYVFLLARCLDLGFLVAAIVWFRHARRSGQPLPALFRGEARPALSWGLGTGLALAGVALLYWWLVPLSSSSGIAGAWPLTIFWPTWARILGLSLVPLVFPLCQEVFFRGAVAGSFEAGGRPKAAIVVSALVFTIAQLSLREAPVFFVIGLALAWVYQRTRSLLAPLTAGFVIAALAITLPALWVGPEQLQELTRKMLEGLQNAGK